MILDCAIDSITTSETKTDSDFFITMLTYTIINTNNASEIFDTHSQRALPIIVRIVFFTFIVNHMSCLLFSTTCVFLFVFVLIKAWVTA